MMVKRFTGSSKWLWLVLVVMLLATLACLGSSSGGGGSVTEAATEQPPTAASGGSDNSGSSGDTTLGNSGGAKTVSLEITNSGTVDVCEVYITAGDAKDWGPDQLDKKKILPGSTFTLNGIPEGVYDLQALDCSGNVLERVSKQDMSGKDFTWHIQANTITLTLNNKSNSIGCKVYLAAPDDKQWGQNLIQDGSKINPGEFITFTGIQPGTYDAHVETCSGNYTWDWQKVDMSSDTTLNMK